METNRNSFIQGRLNRRVREQTKIGNKKDDLMDKRGIVEHATNLRDSERLSLIKHKQERNQDYIDEYKRRMGFENLKKSGKVDFMNSLETREQ